MKLQSVLLVLVIFSYSVVGHSQNTRLNTFVNDSLDAYIEQGMTQWEIPGLSIGIIKNGKLIYSKGYGHKLINTQSPVDSNTLFMIGSLTKAITCATTVIMADKQTLSLNDPISKWLPELDAKGKGHFDHTIIEDILTGRTGLGSHIGDFLFWKTTLDDTDLLRVLPSLKPEVEVRRKFLYNNISYLLLNKILSNTTGKNWSETVETAFFNPLKMKDSYTGISRIPTQKKQQLASSHTKHANKIIAISEEHIDNMGPAGSIVSSATDMSKWMLEFMNSDGVLPSSVKKIIQRPYQLRGYRKTKDHQDQLRFLFSGMGWNIFDEFDKLTYLHDGGTDGSKSLLMVIPEEQYGVVVLTNARSHNFTSALVDELHYALMNQSFQNFSNQYLEDFQNEEKEEVAEMKKINVSIHQNPLKKQELQKYIGTYSNPLYGTMTLHVLNNKLELTFSRHQNNLKGTLDHLGDHRFWLTPSSPEFSPTKVEFSLKENTIVGFNYIAEVSGDRNYWFKRIN